LEDAGFQVKDIDDITLHYARTLRLWRDNFFAHEPEIRALGYPDRFMKMWEFYHSYCEGGFTERHIGDVQMLMSK
jgi:cyclopropane-fatty-acyl-phospholipid synthase